MPVADEQPQFPPDPWGLVAALDQMRDERRRDLDGLEGRLTEKIAEFKAESKETIREFKADVDAYISAHMTVHEAMLKENELFRSKFLSMEMDAAERRGRTFLALKIVQIVGREWRLIAMALFAILTFLGNVQIRIAAP